MSLLIVCIIGIIIGFVIGEQLGRGKGYEAGKAEAILVIREQSLIQGYCLLCTERDNDVDCE